MMAAKRERHGMAADATETSLAKALRLLPIVAERNATGVNLSMVTRRAGMTTATARRLLQGLVDGGLLSFDPYSKLYFLGAEFVRMSRLAGSPQAFERLRNDMHGCLTHIAEQTGDSAFLSVISNGEALCIEKITGSHPISVNTLTVGARRPLGVGAGSLALLAAQESDQRQIIIDENARRFLRYGRLTATAVKRALARWQKDGYVFNSSLIIDGVSAIGLPVFDERGDLVCAVSVGTINARMRPERRAEVAAIIKSALGDIGYKTSRTTDVSHSLL
ncbi:IclR family transcriptional regulator [Roseovarius sp. S4756]|uniref:IclR family transcriptional regulator n=1 Tax=Roseovarius maritimus TaxID=3342637 RepID=UPI00372774C9